MFTFRIGISPKAMQRLQSGVSPVIENAKALFETSLLHGPLWCLDHVGLGHGKKGHGVEPTINELNTGFGIHLEGFASVSHVDQTLPLGFKRRGKGPLVQGRQGVSFLENIGQSTLAENSVKDLTSVNGAMRQCVFQKTFAESCFFNPL